MTKQKRCVVIFGVTRVVALAALEFFDPPAHADQSSIVQCQVGSFTADMPSYVCSAFEAGGKKLFWRAVGGPNLNDNPAEVQGWTDCQAEVLRYITGPAQQVYATCHKIWQDNFVARTMVYSQTGHKLLAGRLPQ
jgi:hypothetical protein